MTFTIFICEMGLTLALPPPTAALGSPCKALCTGPGAQPVLTSLEDRPSQLSFIYLQLMLSVLSRPICCNAPDRPVVKSPDKAIYRKLSGFLSTICKIGGNHLNPAG